MAQKYNPAVGEFCQAPDGRVARIFAWNGPTGRVSYRFDDDGGDHEVSLSELRSSWKPRPDLQDFPGARDPRVPYAFDLLYDIKTRSDLVRALAEGGDDEAWIRESMAAHGIHLSPDEEARLAGMLGGLRTDGWQIVRDEDGCNIHGDEADPFGLNSFDVLVDGAVDTARAWAAENPGYSVVRVKPRDVEAPSYVDSIEAPSPAPGR